MPSDNNAESLSGNFAKNAKDDERKQLDRRFDALGEAGKQARDNLDRQSESIILMRQEEEIEQTSSKRFDQWVLKKVNEESAPRPGERSSPLTQDRYDEIKRQGEQWLELENKRLQASIGNEVEEERNAVARKVLQKMEGQGQQQAQSQDRGQGREI